MADESIQWHQKWLLLMQMLFFFLNYAVDPRKVTLPNGAAIYFLVKEGAPYVPNPELAKILPAINRTAMETFRNAYGISVSQVGVGDERSR